jgi:2,4-dichlorophenol 6-monooxygenase
MRTIDAEVLVVGAGVTGLTASALLAAQGVKTITIARHSGTGRTPRASMLNQRTIEVFRDMAIEDLVRAIGTPATRLGHNVLLTGFQGIEIGRYSCYGAGGHQLSDYTAASPCETFILEQQHVEPVLLTAARERGAEVRWSTELLAIEQTSDHVMAHLRERRTAAEYTIRASYAVAADGARSLVARQLGFGFHGESGLMSMVNTWLEVDLSRYTAHRPGAIYWMIQPGNDYWVGSGTWICHRPFSEWIVSRQYDIADGPPDTSEQGAIAHARTVIGDPEIPIRGQGHKHVAGQPRGGRRVPQRPCLLGRRCCSSASAGERPRRQHINPRCL